MNEYLAVTLEPAALIEIEAATIKRCLLSCGSSHITTLFTESCPTVIDLTKKIKRSSFISQFYESQEDNLDLNLTLLILLNPKNVLLF